jgi:NAD(P)-dependent dehydrogenase (short-subunit alcohol dehydrogenase family)
MKLEGQVAVVTGASRGLGLAIAEALSAEGATVACVARASRELDDAVAGLAARGARARAFAADVTHDGEMKAAIDGAAAAFGRLDLVILNAGGWRPGKIHETSEADWDATVNLNLKGAFLTLRHAIPHLIARGQGTVVAIGSIGALTGSTGAAAYSASKWGLRGLLESAALELKPHRIRVGMIHPHNINSAGRDYPPGTVDRDRNVEPADVARTVAFLCTAPDYVAIGNVTVWPLAAGISSFMG